MISPEDIIIEPYSTASAAEWDAVVDNSRNGTFLLKRAYMDYHADRYEDMSLLVRQQRSGRVVALMSAAVRRPGARDTVTAHAGLTYGGLIIPPATTALEIGNVLKAIVGYYKSLGFTRLIYKPIPSIYHRYPTEEDIYWLIRMGASAEECLLSSTLTRPGTPDIKENTRRNIAKAKSAGLSYRLAENRDDWVVFHSILTETLATRHDASPVHSLDELTLLAERFPDNIKLWLADSSDGETLAGIVLYLTDTVAHAQYIAASPAGFSVQALAGLIDYLATRYLPSVRYFDLGTSNEDHGRILNEGLIRQKTGFGARGTVALTLTLQL